MSQTATIDPSNIPDVFDFKNLSNKEKGVVLNAVSQALRRGDHDEADRIYKNIPLAPRTVEALKLTFGDDYIKLFS